MHTLVFTQQKVGRNPALVYQIRIPYNRSGKLIDSLTKNTRDIALTKISLLYAIFDTYMVYRKELNHCGINVIIKLLLLLLILLFDSSCHYCPDTPEGSENALGPVGIPCKRSA